MDRQPTQLRSNLRWMLARLLVATRQLSPGIRHIAERNLFGVFGSNNLLAPPESAGQRKMRCPSKIWPAPFAIGIRQSHQIIWRLSWTRVSASRQRRNDASRVRDRWYRGRKLKRRDGNWDSWCRGFTRNPRSQRPAGDGDPLAMATQMRGMLQR